LCFIDEISLVLHRFVFGVDMAANGLATGNPGIIGTFNTAYAANTEIGDKPVVVISNT
jgi:hypothetical protein